MLLPAKLQETNCSLACYRRGNRHTPVHVIAKAIDLPTRDQWTNSVKANSRLSMRILTSSSFKKSGPQSTDYQTSGFRRLIFVHTPPSRHGQLGNNSTWKEADEMIHSGAKELEQARQRAQLHNALKDHCFLRCNFSLWVFVHVFQVLSVSS